MCIELMIIYDIIYEISTNLLSYMINYKNWNLEQNKTLLHLIGEAMKLRRIQKEISQEELAKLSGVSHASIARFETGKGNISLSNLLLIMKALNIANELKTIFKEEEPSPLLLSKSSRKKPKSRVRKSKKNSLIKEKVWIWGDEK